MRKSPIAITAARPQRWWRPVLAFAPALLLALALVGLTLYAYRNLPERPFAADDYQWLLNVQERDGGALLRAAFDPAAQTHFYRPLVWLLFWGQLRVFDLAPRGFHAVSLALHLLNAALLAALAYRLAALSRAGAARAGRGLSVHQALIPMLVAAALVALHPAPFEAVVWVSSQSELVAAALLLLMLHLWLFRAPANDRRPTIDARSLGHSDARSLGRSDARSLGRSDAPALLATLVLGLALLAKESAVIGLALLVLAELWIRVQGSGFRVQVAEVTAQGVPAETDPDSPPHLRTPSPPHPGALLLPLALTLGYLLLQVGIERRNYLLASGGYGLGWQLVLNPLRSLGLLVAPLPGTEHADAAWLVPLGGALALALLGGALARALRRRWGAPLLLAALALTLLPTAPFISPPDSRYLYLPVMVAGLALALALMPNTHNPQPTTHNPELSDAPALPHSGAHTLTRSHAHTLTRLTALVLVLLLGWLAAGELAARENRFAGATGPGGSLWRLTVELCAAETPRRILVVDPPLAPPHAEAIVRLACGPEVRPLVLGRAQVAGALKPGSVVVAFPTGSAAIEQRK